MEFWQKITKNNIESDIETLEEGEVLVGEEEKKRKSAFTSRKTTEEDAIPVMINNGAMKSSSATGYTPEANNHSDKNIAASASVWVPRLDNNTESKKEVVYSKNSAHSKRMFGRRSSKGRGA